MSDKSKRVRKLEGLIKEPTPKDTTTLFEPTPKDTTTLFERMQRQKKINKVRQVRRDKWLARATRDQLVIGLKRVDLLEEAWDRKVAEECAAAASERALVPIVSVGGTGWVERGKAATIYQSCVQVLASGRLLPTRRRLR